MYFDIYTGKLSEEDNGYNLEVTPKYFPYHNLDGKYVGFSRPCFNDLNIRCFGTRMKNMRGTFITSVKTYEEMDW